MYTYFCSFYFYTSTTLKKSLLVYKIIKFLLEMSKWEAGNLSVGQKSLFVKRHTEKRLTGDFFLLKVI